MEQILRSAGVTPKEFADLCGVSKNMVYKWFKGSDPHPLRQPKVDRILAAIKAAVDAGDLPLAKEADVRFGQLQAVVIANIKKSA